MINLLMLSIEKNVTFLKEKKSCAKKRKKTREKGQEIDMAEQVGENTVG